MKMRELNIDAAKGRDGETAIESKAVEPFGPVLSEGSVRPKANNPLCAIRISVPFRRLAVSPFRRINVRPSRRLES